MKMKARLTENGVLALYNQSTQTSAKVQVLYLAHLNMLSFLRVTDSKHLSPIMILMKMNDKFLVGDVILIKKVQLQSPGILKDEEILPIIDPDLSHLIILEYQVVESKNKVGVLFTFPNSKNDVNSYWNSLSLIKNSLMKGDNMVESFFKEGEKRLQLLRPDCNLLRERGNELYKKQKFVKAILHYDMAKQKDHYDARVWNNSSQAYFSNNEYDKAKRDALVALKLDPFNTKGYYRAGKAMEMTSDKKSAIEIIEAGLFICGKCEDLEKLLRQIKDNVKPNGGGGLGGVGGKGVSTKKEEILNIPKKKVPNGDGTDVINSDILPNGKPTTSIITTTTTTTSSTIITTTNKKMLKPKDSPLKKIKEPDPKVKVKAENITNDSLSQNAPILSFLEGARTLFETAKFKDALELYKVALSMKISTNVLGPKDMDILKYLVDVCKVKINEENIEDVKNSFLALLSKDNFPFPPAIHYWLAKAYEILDNQDKVIHHANSCLQLVENNSLFYTIYWPGTKDPIPETSPEELKKWFSEGTWRSTPFARCRHAACISIQGHDLAKTEIYTCDLDFRGFVEVECEELCAICYHPCCWKAMKEQKEEGQHGKKTDKDFLGLQCFTPDCCGKICSIRIYDETSHLRNEIAKDKKEKKNAAAAKLKKKKDKKKAAVQGGRTEDKKKIKGNDIDEEKIESEIETGKEARAFKQLMMEKGNCPVDPINYDDANYKVLKPNGEEDFQIPVIKKTKKKKRKGKPLSQINILGGEEIEDRFVHNEYLTRMRALKQQRDAQEADSFHSTEFTGGFKYLPECVLDPERPFYLPQHLQENPAQLESILRAKMAISSSSDIGTTNIKALLEFVYDWLKAQSPMYITDSRIRDYIAEYFPQNAVAYVNKCGGIRSFLLQSFGFALIDEIICVNEQVVSAQEMAVQAVLEKFKSSKYLISDGHKAVKLSHLLDDSKSSCSSNSSQSTNQLNTPNSLDGIPGLPPKTVIVPVAATSYKNAALGKIATKELDVRSEASLKSVKLKPQNTKKQKESELPKKPKLKTMDIDAFEVIGAAEMGHLFSPPKPFHNGDGYTKSSSAVVKGEELFFNSDDEMDLEMSSIQTSSKQKQAIVCELKENITLLEAELNLKLQDLERIAEEKEILSSQNQDLNDKYSQIKMKSNVEISAWKKRTEDAQEQIKIAETNLDCYRSQKDGEVRKLLAEKSRHQDELKAYSLKVDSLQLTIDQLNSAKAQLEEELKQKSIQLTEQQMQIMKYQDSVSSLDERARDAEFKYLSMKRDLIKMNLEKTKKRLTAEKNKMQELYQEASDETQPNKNILIRSINDWEETISKLHNTLQAVMEDGQRYLDYIRSGRPLNALPPGDLQIPSVPDLTVAHLLYVGKPLTSKISEKLASHSSLNPSSMGFLGMIGSSMSKPSNLFTNISGNHPSQFGPLGSGGTFSLGQLGIGANPRNNDNHLGVGSSLLSDHTLGGGSGSRLGDGQLRNGSSQLNRNLGVNSRMNEASTSFMMNGVTSNLSNLIREDLASGSCESSPITVPSVSIMTSLSVGGSEHHPTYSMGAKQPSNADQNQIFVGQLPWNFTDDHLKTVFSQFGEVMAAAIHDKGHTNEGKPVPKCGFVTYRSQQERDLALQAGPLTYGTHTLNIQAKEMKRSTTKIIPPPSTIMGSVPDLPLIPPSSNVTPLTHPSSQPSASINKPMAPSSAFGLHSLLEASSRVPPRTIATPTTPTATKPKFQNLRSANVGAIGTLPPKVVRPIPRTGTTAIGVAPGMHSLPKEDLVNNSASYKRLIEECKKKFGTEYPIPIIHKVIRDVREQNKGSLSGLTLETILEQVDMQLRIHKKLPSKPSVAPWAQITQNDGLSEWQGPIREVDIGEDHCAICLDMLSPTHATPLPCQHMFHVKCINNWLTRKSDCPICRKFALNSDEYPSLSHG